jgi:hypothetical protein
MKPFLLFIMLAFGAQWCVAQDYKCVRYGDTAYFINVDGYLRGMRINGVVAYGGGDTLLMPFETERPGNGSWMGNRIMDRHDGMFTFNTRWMDTVFVQTHAEPGDTWMFYNDTSTRYYKATVMSVDTMRVLGVLDSVKKIRIAAYWAGFVNMTDSVNGFEMVLSKEHGFVQTFDLYNFPYRTATGGVYSDFYQDRIGYPIGRSKMTFVRTEFHVPTKMGVYDFNVGDVFVTRGWTEREFPELSWLTYDSIISKTLPDAWRVHYQIFRKEISSETYYSWGSPSITHNSFQKETYDIEFDTSRLFSMLRMPEEKPSMPLVWHYRPTDSGNCFKSAYYKRQSVVTFEGGPSYEEYKTGFEQLSSGTHTPPWGEDIGYHSSRQAELIFSVKNGVPCGVRVEPNRVEQLHAKEAGIRIYPNPAKDELHISAGSVMEDVSITDVAGRVLYSAEQLPAESKVDVSGFAAGVYLLRVNGAVQKFVKQ